MLHKIKTERLHPKTLNLLSLLSLTIDNYLPLETISSLTNHSMKGKSATQLPYRLRDLTLDIDDEIDTSIKIVRAYEGNELKGCLLVNAPNFSMGPNGLSIEYDDTKYQGEECLVNVVVDNQGIYYRVFRRLNRVYIYADVGGSKFVKSRFLCHVFELRSNSKLYIRVRDTGIFILAEGRVYRWKKGVLREETYKYNLIEV